MPLNDRFCRAAQALVAGLLGGLLVACAFPVTPPQGAGPIPDHVVAGRPGAPPAASAAPGNTPAVAAASALAPVPTAVTPAPADAGAVLAASAGVAPEPDTSIARGLASWYGPKFHGRRTASGERYDMHGLTAAHRTLPFGTRVRVRSVATGKDVVVRINDRGPFKRTRIIDLSLGAVTALGLRQRGVTEVVLLRE